MLSKGIQKQKDDSEEVYLHVELDWGAQKDMAGAGALPGKRKAVRKRAAKGTWGSKNDKSTFTHVWKCHEEIQHVIQLICAKVTSQQQKPHIAPTIV